MKVKNRLEAWDLARQIFSQDFECSNISSTGSDYPIFKPTVRTENNFYDQIADLNSRLEVIVSGKVFNIEIEEEEPVKERKVKTFNVDIETRYEEKNLHYDALSIISVDDCVIIPYVDKNGEIKIDKYDANDVTLYVTP